MKKYSIVLFALFASILLRAQNVKDIQKIEINGNVKLTLIASTECKLVLNNEDVSYEVSGNFIEFNSKGPNPEATLYIKSLKYLELNGASQVNMPSNLKSTEGVTIEASGASKANLQVNAPEIIASASGASQIKLSGSATTFHAEATGASKIFASDCKSENVTVETNGASEAQVFASQSIIIEANGVSKVNYDGNPQSREIEKNGVSKIYDRGVEDVEALKTDKVAPSVPPVPPMPDLPVAKENNDTVTISMGKSQMYVITREVPSDKCDTCKKLKKEIVFSNDEKETVQSDEEKQKKAKKRASKVKNVWSGFEMGFDNLITTDYKTSIPNPSSFLTTRMGSSYHFGVNLFESNWQIIKGRMALATGLGIEHISFRMDADSVLDPNASLVKPNAAIQQKMNSNRFTLTNFNIPLLLKYNSKPDKHDKCFHIAAGVIGTWDPYATLKWNSTANGYEENHSYDYDTKVNPFRMSATVRVGYGHFKLFANYGLTPLFKSNTGAPDVRIAQVGMTIISF